MSSKTKKAKAKKKQKDNKIPEIDYPVFDFRYLHKDYSLNVNKDKLPDIDRASLVNQLYLLSKFSWDDIMLAPRHGIGSEKIAIKSIIPSMPYNVPDDILYYNDFFLALRYNGKKSIVGVRKGSIFYILYIDYNFTVYPHSKK